MQLTGLARAPPVFHRAKPIRSAIYRQFLTGDGAIVVTFEPALTAKQAKELAAMVREPGSADELALLLEAVADD